MDQPSRAIGARRAGTDLDFGGRWPYAARFGETEDGRVAFYDEGDRGDGPVILLHGNPTWSYLYRRLIPPLLARGRRVIAVDHLGFGRSDKPDRSAAFQVSAHADRLEALLESLDLHAATLVVHDWSGPIGLRWAVHHPDRIERLMILNTFAPLLPGPIGGRAATRVVRLPGIGSLLVRRRAMLTERFLFSAGLSDPGVLDEVDREAYRAPHPDPASRTAVLSFPREIPFRPGDPVAELCAENAAGLASHFTAKPVVLAWGMQDVLFGPEVLGLWRKLLPDAEVTKIDRAGHFIQEDAPDQVEGALLALMGIG